MKTEELLALLANGAEPIDRAARARRDGLVLAGGLLGALALTVVVLGLGPLATESTLPMFWAREAFCALLAGAALVAAVRLGEPGRGLGAVPAAMALPLAAMWLLALAVLAPADAPERAALLMGSTARVCPWLIALVSVPVFAALVVIMRERAPTRLRWAGAACGLAAGTSGALVYTLHCPELAAPFLAVWYVLGMLLPALAGGWLGPRLLRW